MLAVDVLSNPGFFVSYAAIQAVALLVLVRLLDPFERVSIGLLALLAVWGATGAALIALIGNEAVKGLLQPDAREVFGNTISAPVVEEAAKGLALLAVVVVVLWFTKRSGILALSGVSAWMACGAAVGLGFSFTEDFFYFVNRSSTEGVQAGADLFLGRRDFFGPTALHHPLFTAALGAGIGLAVWSRSIWGKVGFPLLGLGIAVVMHAVNNGLVELIIVLRHGLDAATAWVNDVPVSQDVQTTADVSTAALVVLDYVWLVAFLVAIGLWQRYQRRVIARQLASEVDTGVVSEADRDAICTPLARPRLYWRLFRQGRLDRLQRLRDLHTNEARLGLLKWQIQRFGGDRRVIGQQRRRVVALSSIAESGGALPRPRNSLIGRAAELEALEEMLTGAGPGIVTLSGPGGTGKTRLALELAQRLEEEFPSGAYLVDLAPMDDPARVPEAIAHELGIREIPGEDRLGRVCEYLRDKQLLLVLDNFEQVIQAAPAVNEIASKAPRVRTLITSRTPLRIASEAEYAVVPLAVATEAADVDPAPAVQLFLERARAASPDFDPSGDDREAVVSICERLDGLPLAIELAAARVDTLSPPAILRRVAEGTKLPGAVRQDLPERQRNLTATVGWSEELLDEPSRSLFRRIAVFPVGCRLDSASSVFDEAASEETLLEMLSQLRRASLVLQEPDPDGEPRFKILETIRGYALDQLDDGERRAAQRAAANHLLEVADTAGSAPPRRDPEQWIALLDAEYENLTAALGWLVDAGDPDRAVTLAVSLGSFWERSHIVEIRDWLLDVLATADGKLDQPRVAAATRLAGRLSLLSSEYEKAEILLDQAERSNSLSGADRARVASDSGWVHLFRGEYAKGEAQFRRALELSEGGDAAARGQCLANVGRARAEQLDLEEARVLFEESVGLRREADDLRGVVSSLGGLGRVELLSADPRQASRHLEEAIALARRLRDDLRIAEVLYPLSLLALDERDFSRATELLEERLRLCDQLGDALGVAESLEGLSLADGALTDPERDAALLGASSVLRDSIGAEAWAADRDRVERHEQTLQGKLGSDGFEAARARGRVMRPAEALAYALAPRLQQKSSPS